MKDSNGRTLPAGEAEEVHASVAADTDRPSRTREGNLSERPAGYRTPQRPGQPGEQDQHRPGPSPLSENPTGPHAPYEADDPEGLAAGKHTGADGKAGSAESRISEGISVLGEDR